MRLANTGHDLHEHLGTSREETLLESGYAGDQFCTALQDGSGGALGVFAFETRIHRLKRGDSASLKALARLAIELSYENTSTHLTSIFLFLNAKAQFSVSSPSHAPPFLLDLSWR
jgi:hypothetical protein